MRNLIKSSILILAVSMLLFTACSKSDNESSENESSTVPVEDNLTVEHYSLDDGTDKKVDDKVENYAVSAGDTIKFNMSDSENIFTVSELTDEIITFSCDQRYIINNGQANVDYNTVFSVKYGETVTLQPADDDSAYYAVFTYGQAAETGETFEDKASAFDNNSKELASVTAEYYDSDGENGITTYFTLENNSDNSITWMGFTVQYYNEDNELINTEKIAFDLEDSPLSAGNNTECSRTLYFDGASETSCVKISDLTIKSVG